VSIINKIGGEPMSDLLIQTVMAQEDAPAKKAAPQGGGMHLFIMFGLIIFIFYFFMIRPQKKRQEKQQQLLFDEPAGPVRPIAWRGPSMHDSRRDLTGRVYTRQAPS